MAMGFQPIHMDNHIQYNSYKMIGYNDLTLRRHTITELCQLLSIIVQSTTEDDDHQYDSESAGSPSAKSSGSDALGSPKKLTDVTEEEEGDGDVDEGGKTQEDAKKGTSFIFYTVFTTWFLVRNSY